MMKLRFEFQLLTLAYYDRYMWQFSMGWLQTDDWRGSLLLIQCDYGEWDFDFLYLASAIRTFKNWAGW